MLHVNRGSGARKHQGVLDSGGTIGLPEIGSPQQAVKRKHAGWGHMYLMISHLSYELG